MSKEIKVSISKGCIVAEPSDDLPVDSAGGIVWPRMGFVGRKYRNKDQGSKLALYAVEQALSTAFDEIERPFPHLTGVVVSSNFGTLEAVCALQQQINNDSVAALSALALPQVSSNVIAGWLSIEYGLRGPSLTICDDDFGGMDALRWGVRLIQSGRASSVVVVGVEPASTYRDRLVGGAPSKDVAAAVVLSASYGEGGPYIELARQDAGSRFAGSTVSVSASLNFGAEEALRPFGPSSGAGGVISVIFAARKLAAMTDVDRGEILASEGLTIDRTRIRLFH